MKSVLASFVRESLTLGSAVPQNYVFLCSCVTWEQGRQEVSEWCRDQDVPLVEAVMGEPNFLVRCIPVVQDNTLPDGSVVLANAILSGRLPYQRIAVCDPPHV